MDKKRSLIFRIVLFFSLILNIGLGIFTIRTMNWNSNVYPCILAEKDKLADENKKMKQAFLIAYRTKIDVFMAVPNDTNDIVFLGNSLTANFPVTELFNDTRIRNREINGDGIAQILQRLNEVTEGKPKKIFIEIGINDITNSQPMDSIKKNYSLLIQRIREESPFTVIYLQSLFPTSYPVDGTPGSAIGNIKLLNTYLQQIADNKQIKYINLFDTFYYEKGLNPKYDCGDQLHLNGAGYLAWRDLIKDYVNE